MSETPLQSSAELRLFAEALLSGSHSFANLAKEFCIGDDEAIDLTGRTSGDELEALRGSKVIPAPGVLAYLAGGDEITHAILDAAEIATERHYQLTDGWIITSSRDQNPVRLRYFYLERE